MAGRGPAPKDPSERRHRIQPAPLTVIQSDGGTHGPALPDSHEWPDVTLAWWETWRTCAQAKSFTDTDWSFLLDTALLHMEFWDGDRGLAAELRLRAAKFGATPEDRARLKIAVGDPPAASAPRGRTPAARTRRSRVLKAVEDVG
jgi:hypothetical protein